MKKIQVVNLEIECANCGFVEEYQDERFSELCKKCNCYTNVKITNVIGLYCETCGTELSTLEQGDFYVQKKDIVYCEDCLG